MGSASTHTLEVSEGPETTRGSRSLPEARHTGVVACGGASHVTAAARGGDPAWTLRGGLPAAGPMAPVLGSTH